MKKIKLEKLNEIFNKMRKNELIGKSVIKF